MVILEKFFFLVFLSLFFCISSFADVLPASLVSGGVVIPNDKPYYKYKDERNDIELIYTKENLPFAKHTFGVEQKITKEYRKFYQWKLDDTLYVGLASSENQIANGFSTQYSNNKQINYLGGTQMVDYFTSASWLDTLLYHESAHNYQLNIKSSKVSQTLNSVFKSGSFIIPFISIAIPNSFENSFMLEGNAVLNESWHGNGGRLYSGRFFVETLLQAKEGNINASDVYNKKKSFPYSDNHYIIGGFYNLYMAQNYGMKEINSYFINHSKYWYWPFFTNRSMYDSAGINFEKSLNDFSIKYAKIAQNVVLARGEKIASSQYFYPLNSDKDEIFFITQKTGLRAPTLIILNKKDLKIKKQQESWVSGKVIKKDAKYYTQGSMYISPTKIKQGLFDKNGFIKKQTESKMIQGYMSDGRDVYFDVSTSYFKPQLYIGKKFYTQTNSSVFIDANDNIYYFKQDLKTRTLYKNDKKLFSYKGFYGIVSDVDENGDVYFIANSKFGSTLYKYDMKKITRVVESDNIIDAKLIDKQRVLVCAISAKDYYYSVVNTQNIDEIPFEVKFFFENKKYYDYKNLDINTSDVDLLDPYHSVLDMHYIKTNFGLAYINDAVEGILSINFSDPLSQNAASIFASRDDENISIVGVGYSNSQYLLKYTFMGYMVADDNGRDDIRDGGFIVDAELPFYRAGYYYGSVVASFYQDYLSMDREPLTLSVNFSRSEEYGYSMYKNYLNYISLYGSKDRGDNLYGFSYKFKHDFDYEFYLDFDIKYSKTDANIKDSKANTQSRGVKLKTTQYSLDMDPSIIDMPSIDTTVYLKKASYADVVLKKVINLSAYFFTFPVSLQRESLYLKYRYYDLEKFNDKKINIDEFTLGTTLKTVLFNNYELPLSFEYIYNNDTSGMVQNKNSFRFTIGTGF
jgi:hypothetical protein